MDRITQANAASAQQSASSAEEMKQQAAQVRAAVDELMRLVRGAEPELAGVPSAATASAAAVKQGASADAFAGPTPAAGPILSPKLGKKPSSTATKSAMTVAGSAKSTPAVADEHFV
jgi:methyl-accepting chemotaxis protein